MALLEIQGDLIELAKEGRFDVIVHGCNCMCTMGSGIAVQIRRNFPEAWMVDQQTQIGDGNKLGKYSSAVIPKYGITVVNAYTQYTYGGEHPLVLTALDSSLSLVARDFLNKRIGLPRIGAGLGGGDWPTIKGIMERVFSETNATLVSL